MFALIGLLLSTTAVLLLNLGWGKRKTESWAAGCVAGSAWIGGISIYLAGNSNLSGFFATIVFVSLLIIGKFARLSARSMAIGSWSIFSVFWIWALVAFVPLYSQYEEWKKQVPMVSMSERLPEPKPSDVEPISYSAIAQEGELLDTEFSKKKWNARNRSIQLLHTGTLAAFDRAAGFGSIRMIVFHPEAEYFLPDSIPPVSQPTAYNSTIVSLGDQFKGKVRPNLRQIHRESRVDFTNPQGAGYVKSRSEVAGFQSHRFSRLPNPENGWKADRIDLISLLMHDKPVAYISESLPRMEDIGNLKTRELDEFETAGLAHVRKTEELFIRGNDKSLRVIGALRSVNECQKCHGGSVGDLLGAFSYTLTKLEK